MELWVRLIQLVLIPFADDFLSQLDLQVRIRERANISRGEVEAFENIETYLTVLWVLQIMNNCFLIVLVHDKPIEVFRVDVEFYQVLFHFVSFLRSSRSKDVLLKLLIILHLADLVDLLLDLLHDLGFAHVVLFISSFIVYVNVTFELAHDLFIGFVSRLVSVGRKQNVQNALVQASGLPSLDVDVREGLSEEDLLVVLQFVDVVLSVVLVSHCRLRACDGTIIPHLVIY